MLFKHAENGILVYDDKGRFVEANRVACQWLGYQRSELLKRSLADILVQDEQTGDLLSARSSRLVSAGKSTGLEMAALVKKLTAYAGLWRYTPTPVELHSVIRKTIEELQPTIPRKVAVVHDEPTGPAVIWGDAEQIHQMFNILFCNALEAIGKEEGSIRVTVSATTLENRDIPDWSFAGIAPASGAYTVLTVQDNGCGIAIEGYGENIRAFLFDEIYWARIGPVGGFGDCAAASRRTSDRQFNRRRNGGTCGVSACGIGNRRDRTKLPRRLL